MIVLWNIAVFVLGLNVISTHAEGSKVDDKSENDDFIERSRTRWRTTN